MGPVQREGQLAGAATPATSTSTPTRWPGRGCGGSTWAATSARAPTTRSSSSTTSTATVGPRSRCKTADGTVDGAGHVIGDAAADWRNTAGLHPHRPRVPHDLRRPHRRRAGHHSLRRAARHGRRLGRHVRQPRRPVPGHRRLSRRAAAQPGDGPRLLHARGAGGLELARRGARRTSGRSTPGHTGTPQPVRGLARPGQPQPHASATWTATAATRSSTARRRSTTTAPASTPPASATATRST